MEDFEKEKTVNEVVTTAKKCSELLKDLQLHLQAITFEDGLKDRLSHVKKIVDEVELHTNRYQKMNVELNFVENSFVEGMSRTETTPEEKKEALKLAKFKSYKKKLDEYAKEVETVLMDSDIMKRSPGYSKLKSETQWVSLSEVLATVSKNWTQLAINPILVHHPQLQGQSVPAKHCAFHVKLMDTLVCLLRFEGGGGAAAPAALIIKHPSEPITSYTGAAVIDIRAESPVERYNRIDFHTPSRFYVFRLLTLKALTVLQHLGSVVSDSRPRELLDRFFQWLVTYGDMFSQPCRLCGHLLNRHHLPPLCRDLDDLSRIYHEVC